MIQEPFPGLSGGARLAGVVGWPVSHSRSPRLHGYWLRELSIDGAYLPLAVAPENLERALRALPVLGFRGVNLTVPHKEQALAFMDELDPVARRIGAVNTVVVAADGRLAGSNTDPYGFIENLREQVPGFTGSRGPALVLGAGGAARAVVVALLDAGVPEVMVANRNLARAEELAAAIGGPISPKSWDERNALVAEAALVVNTTVLGMTGQPPLDIDLARAGPKTIVYDIVYSPLETPLLRAARARGLVAVDGLGMLIHQARPGFAAWFGKTPRPSDALRAMLLRDLGQKS